MKKADERYCVLYDSNYLESIEADTQHLSWKKIKEKRKEEQTKKEQLLIEQEKNYNSQNHRNNQFKCSMLKVKEFKTQCEKMNHLENISLLGQMDFEAHFHLAEELISFIHKYHYENIFHDELFYLRHDINQFYKGISEELGLLIQLKVLNKEESDLYSIFKRFNKLDNKINLIQEKYMLC